MAKKKASSAGGVSPKMAIRMTGPKVGEARLSASDLAEIVRRTQQALQRVGQVLHGQVSDGAGRKRRDIEELCELFLVGWKRGSAVAELELGEPPAQLNMFGCIGEESLKTFLNGMNEIAKGGAQPSRLPPGFDTGVLQTCDALGKVLDHGIETIRFDAANGEETAVTTFDTPLREKVRELLGQPVDVSDTVRTGRLEELNGHGALTGRLWEADGTKWMCYFKSEHLAQLSDAWMRNVKVVGKAVIDGSKERTFNVESLLLLEEEIVDSAVPGAVAPFWKAMSLDELAEQQGVSPVSDLDEISALWPVDDNPDDLLHHTLHERRARRKLMEGGDQV